MPQKDRREEIVKEYYNNYKDDERFVPPHRKVEFITTVNYIEKFLKKGNKIVELGAGTGTYSMYFAKKGNPINQKSHLHLFVEDTAEQLGVDI